MYVDLWQYCFNAALLTACPIFKPFNGDRCYEAAKAAMNTRLEEELEKMKIEQVTTG